MDAHRQRLPFPSTLRSSHFPEREETPVRFPRRALQPYRRPRLAVSRLLVATLVVALGAGATPVQADPIADKKAEAERVAKELEAQGERVSVLAEQLNQARLKATQLADQVRVAEGELAAADKEVAAVRGRLRDRAVASYVGGSQAGDLPIEQLLSSGSANDLVVRRTYASTVAGQERATAAMLDSAQEVRRAQRSRLDAAKAAAEMVLHDVATQQTAAERAASERRATLGRVQGELKSLVEAEQARIAAEEARRVQAELAARQAREAAARAAAAAAAREREEAARRTTTTTLRLPAVSIPRLPAVGGSGGGDDEPAGDTTLGPPAAGAATAVAEAKRQLGKPYDYGGSGPDSFDCSGLTSWAWRAGGRSLPHSSAAQYGVTARVPVSQIEPGDLVFYGSPIHHVGIYAGDGMMVEASETGTPVRMASIYRRDLVGVGRVG